MHARDAHLLLLPEDHDPSGLALSPDFLFATAVAADVFNYPEISRAVWVDPGAWAIAPTLRHVSRHVIDMIYPLTYSKWTQY